MQFIPLHSDPTESPPPFPPVGSNTTTSDASPDETLTLSEVPVLPTAEPAATPMSTVIPAPALTSAPSAGNFSCVENWCSENGSS